jgi:hypothetical protein
VAEQASGHHSMSSEISFKITHTFYEDETTPTQNAMKGKKYYGSHRNVAEIIWGGVKHKPQRTPMDKASDALYCKSNFIELCTVSRFAATQVTQVQAVATTCKQQKSNGHLERLHFQNMSF